MSDENTENPTKVAGPTSLSDLKPKMKLIGVVNRLELYGAFIDIGVGVNALVHISKLGKERTNRVSDVLTEGQEVTVWVEKVDVENQQVMVTMVEPLAVEWNDLQKDQVYTGRINRLENFGVFVDVGAEREGLVHISELSHDYVKHPSEVYKVGEEVQVKVLGFSRRKRRIDLSIKALLAESETAVATATIQSQARQSKSEPGYDDDVDDYEEEAMPTAMEIAMRRAMGESAPRSTKRRGRRRRKSRARLRAEQEDILNRTLQVRHDG